MNKIKSDKVKDLFEYLREEYHAGVMFDFEEVAETAEQESEKRAVKALTHALKYMTSLSKEQKIAIAMHFDDALNDGGQDNE